MLYKTLLVLLIIDAVLLTAAVLLQSGKGGGLAASFGGASSSTDALFGTRQAGNLLTKASWWCGGIFIGLAFVLQLSMVRSKTPTSVLDNSFQEPARTTAPVPSGATAPSSAPSVLLQPTTPAPATEGKSPASTAKPEAAPKPTP